MGRFIAFIGAAILIIIGLVFIFDLDTKLFTTKSSNNKEIDTTRSESINVGGITLGVKNEIDSVSISIGGIDGVAFSKKTDFGNCYKIQFEPNEGQISLKRFEFFQKYLEHNYEILFIEDSIDWFDGFEQGKMKLRKIRRLHVFKQPINFEMTFRYKEDALKFLLEIVDTRIDPFYNLKFDTINWSEIDAEPKDSAHYYLINGVNKDDSGDFQGAIQDYNKAIEINPYYGEAYFHRGVAKYELEDYRGAIQDYNKAIEINPNSSNAYYNRGLSKAFLEDYRGAIQDFTKAIEINPNDSEDYISRGISKYYLGDVNGACLDWSKAGELGEYQAYDLIKKYCN